MRNLKTRFHKTMSLLAAFSVFVQAAMPALTILPQLSPAYAEDVVEEQQTTPTPEPTSETTIAPTPTEESTPTPTAEVTPTIEATPTVTATPTETVTATPTQGSQQPQGSDNQPPQNNGPPAEQGQILDGVSTTATETPTPTVAPAEPETGELQAVVLQNVEAESLDLDNVDPGNSASLSTDKADYAPTDTAVITGKDFTPGEVYTLTITSENSPPTSLTVEITADENGEFVYAYQLDGNYRPFYRAEAKNSQGEVVSVVTFTDSETVAATIPFSDSFGPVNSDQNDVANWYDSDGSGSNIRVNNGNGRPSSPTDDYARIEGAGRICRTINATGYQSLILKYYWLGDDDAENNEFGRIQYKTTGSCSDINGWADQASHELENQTSWSSEQTTNLPASLNGTTFYLRFVSEANQTEETFRIDDVSITGTVIGPQADLTATKTNNVSNNATVNQPFTWTIRVQNSGAASATFASGNTILTDNLPDSGVTYGSPSVTKSNGTVTGTINCSINSSNLSCTASGGSVVIPVGQYIDVSFSATFSSTGSKVNPRSGGSNVCKADPSSTNGVIPESNEGNNTCSNTVNVATVQPVANPSFPNSCGLDVALVIDSSLSIDSTELGQMKTAFQNFVNAFLPATPTQFSVTEFDTTATVTQAFTSNTTLINNAINNAASSGYTNWEDGLLKAQSTLPNRSNFNLVLFASDGNPNTIGNGPGDNASPDGSTTAMNPAITAANAIKTAGSRIIALGIGNELSTANLQAISGPNVNTGVTSDVITSNFSTLATDLATLANQLCGGTITARKMIGQNPASNWTFTINGQNYVTDANGYTQAVSVSPGTYSVTETQKNGYAMTSASCTGATNNGSQGVNSVTGVQVAANNIVSCVFNNSLSAFCGDGVKNGAEQCDGSDLGGLSSSVFSCSNQCTLNLIDPKVTICHATDSHSNPYITNQPNKSADVSGHDGHTGPIWFPGITQTWGDIIPPFDYVGGSYPGKNWTTEGQAIYNSQCTMAPGTLIVQKTTLPAADQTSFAITATGSGTITGGGAGTITDANDKSYTVTPGIYSVTEDVPTGWTQTSNTCSNVSVASGQTKTCVITNGKLPTITVNKVVVNDDGGQKEIEDFALFINAVQTNSGDVKIVPPGAYTISETADNGYVGTISGDCTTNGNVTVAYGDTKVCTITNDDIPGSLTVHKLVDRDGNGTFEEADPSDFTWTIDGSGSYVMGATNTDVAIGMRAIGENSPAGYHFVSWYPTGATDDNQRAYSCDNPQSTSLPINVNVGPGGTSDYTLCNARDMGTVTFEKLVVGGNASPSAWTFTVASVSGAFHSGDSATLPTGTYSVTESGGDANYSATSATGICSALQNQTASLTVTTEGGTCTFTNTHDTGSVKVNKRTDKNGDGDYTDSGEGVNGSASNAFTWSLDGSGTNVMGATVADILTGNHDVNENTVANYHFVGWFTNGGQYSCTNPEGTTLPVTVGVTKGNTAEITLCNARDAGTVTIIKNAINNSENNFSFDTNLPGGDFELEDDGNDNNGGTEESKTVIAATGAYTIKENNESGWKLTGLTCDDNNGQVNLETRTATVNVSAGEQITCTFTNTELAKVWGFKFYDKNGNAAWNLLQGELGLGNWRIFIDENENQAYDVGESNKLTSNFFLTRGYYEFTNLLPGTYTICEELQTGWKNTLPLCQTVELSPGEVDHFVDFGNIDVGDLTVTKYNDENGNGVRDEGEEVLSGWEINLTGEDSQTTGENGTVLFANLPKGTYGLSETMQPQWRQTNISCSNDPEVTPTPSPTPGDEEETGGTCHYDEGENEYSAINVPITNPGHSNHEFDFEYEGEYSITGQEGQLADEWCNENIPEQEVEVRKETFLGISKVHAQRVSEEDESTHPVTVEPGEHVTCEIGNQVVNPELTITKSNNTGGADKGPGDSVMFTIEVTASDSAVLGVTVTDLPSLGFTYEPGSWTANSNVRGDLKTALVTTEPTYASPGDWILGDMVAGETVTLTYLAKIGGDIQSGLYRDLAWSEGTDLLSAEVVANDDTGVFVGTEVNVVKGDVQGVSTNVVKEEGSVLGASTELPATGASIFWLAMAGILGLTGVTSMTLGLALARRNKKSKRRLHA